MNAALDILIHAADAGPELTKTAASLAAQTDRGFSVLLSEASRRDGLLHLDAAQKELEAAGIAVRRIKPPFELKGLEHWNWLHALSRADWLKPLAPGEQLNPIYVARLKERIRERPMSRFIRCDVELRTEWGPETTSAPFQSNFITPAEFPTFFPASVGWISHSINVAYSRAAWLGTGGYSAHHSACAALNANVILALHHGVENISETLVTTDQANGECLNESRANWVNHSLELWLILRQAGNYCRAAKIPWSEKRLFLRGMLAALKRG